MIKKKNIIRNLICLVLVCILSIQTPFAAEITTDTAEDEVLTASYVTWYSGQKYDAAYSFTDYNLTPIKIMGNSGKLVVKGNFVKNDSASYSNIMLTAEIRDADTKQVLNSTVALNTSYPSSNAFVVSANVYAGERIQIFFDASSINNPPGTYRKAYISYSCQIS